MNKSSLLAILMTIMTALPSYAGDPHSNNRGIPDDFDARHSILLIEDSPSERRSDRMELIMKKFYPYKYKIETKEDVRGMRRDTAYADRSVYRYIIGNDERLVSMRSTNGSVYNSSFEVYAIYDMQEEKSYPAIRSGNGFSAGTFKHDIKALVRYMNKLK